MESRRCDDGDVNGLQVINDHDVKRQWKVYIHVRGYSRKGAVRRHYRSIVSPKMHLFVQSQPESLYPK